MKLFFSYLRQRRRGLAMAALFFAVFLVTFALYRLPLAALVYPGLLCLLLGAVFLLTDFFRVRKKHLALVQAQNQSAQLLHRLPAADSMEEVDYRRLLEALQAELDALRAADEKKYRDMTEYYTLWAHQIKTPIASMRLTLQNEDSPLSRQLQSDLLRVEQYAQMVLAFLRLDAPASDYVFRTHALDDIIRQAVKKFAGEFIRRKIRLEFTPTGSTLVTDEKWLCFVLEQLLSNALKYTRQGAIRIYLTAPKILCVEDTGIGIAPEDLPRIFEKGYTGCNGRVDKQASGIGLYLCRRVCKNLGIGIEAASEVGKGTTLRLDLEQYPLKSE